MRECQRLCTELQGRVIAGWRIVEIRAQEAEGIERIGEYARLVLHVEPTAPTLGARPHWSTMMVSVPRLREYLSHPETLIRELFQPEDQAPVE